MNQQQRNYAIERISETKKAKIAAVTERFTTQEKKVSSEEKIEMIRRGKVKLNKTVRNHDYLVNSFDFSKHESEKKIDHAKADPIIASINEAARKATDNIMLAGDAEALKAIEDFEKAVGRL